MEWTDISITVAKRDADTAEAIATMVANGGIYIEDYSDLEQQAWEIAHVDLIEQDLLDKPRDIVIVHMYLAPDENPAEAPDPATARRRIGFYLRAGARATALESRVFGTRYAVLALPCGGTVPDAALCKELRTLYKVMVPHPYYRGQVIFYGS